MMDLFAGCGGFSAGFASFRPAGVSGPVFESVAAVEVDSAAAATYKVNNPHTQVFEGAIADYDPGAFAGTVDVVLGGLPHQGFSSVRAVNVGDPRINLWRNYVSVVQKVQPKVFVLEHVDRFLHSTELIQLQATVAPGEALEDYALTAIGILNAADYGVHQTRRRAIVIGTHRDLMPLAHPPTTHGKHASAVHGDLVTAARPWETVRSIFEKSGHRGKVAESVLPERTCAVLGTAMPGTFRTTELHISSAPALLSEARYRAIPPGGSRHDLRGKWAIFDDRCTYLSTPSWDMRDNGPNDTMGRLHIDRPSGTIRSEFYRPEKGRSLHPFEDRPITHYEAALIQGFPDDYLWCGTRLSIGMQIGNAVPVGFARAIAGAVYEHLIHE
ncbi:DNA cytosine methyltransferase [Streptomyces triculaminicus]|uniref:DNA cytosine methyltransferase n=1 Tax=Streptomyces triculaminicus TaxID=2816232 RepID=UPI0037B495D6